MKYKVGQKVRIIKNCGDSNFNKYIGTIVTILDCDSDTCFLLDIKEDSEYTYWDVNEFVAVNRLNKLKRIMS